LSKFSRPPLQCANKDEVINDLTLRLGALA
jgi:hypothetical protein